MRWMSAWVLFCVLLAGCGGQAPLLGPERPTPIIVPTNRVASPQVPPTGGVPAAQTGSRPQAAAPDRPTPTPWYPIVRYVAPSTLPYDPKEAIQILPVYACPKQSCQWLGDLSAGLQVSVTALSEDGLDCFVTGKVVQGWDVEGWVSCSRLAAQKPAGTP